MLFSSSSLHVMGVTFKAVMAANTTVDAVIYSVSTSSTKVSTLFYISIELDILSLSVQTSDFIFKRKEK